jgi:hypothetical protein
VKLYRGPKQAAIDGWWLNWVNAAEIIVRHEGQSRTRYPNRLATTAVPFKLLGPGRRDLLPNSRNQEPQRLQVFRSPSAGAIVHLVELEGGTTRTRSFGCRGPAEAIGCVGKDHSGNAKDMFWRYFLGMCCFSDAPGAVHSAS